MSKARSLIFLLLVVAASSIAETPAVASPLVPVFVEVTDYHIQATTIIGDNTPEPRIVLDLNGDEVTRDFDHFCDSVGGGCILPPAPPAGWMDTPFITRALDYPYDARAAGADRLPLSIQIVERNDFPFENQRRMVFSGEINVSTGQITGSVAGTTFTGVVDQKMCAWDLNSNGICFVVTGPSDRDGDGLFDSWEENDIVPTQQGDVEITGADPDHKDIFVEIDWTQGSQPTKVVLDRVREAFRRAPFYAGGAAIDLTKGINIHFDTGFLQERMSDGSLPLVGENLGGGRQIGMINPNWCGLSDGTPNFFNTSKALNFATKRDGIFYYMVSKGLSNCNPCAAPAALISGVSGTSPMVVTTATSHGLATGQQVFISNVLGTVAANGSWTATVINATSFSLNGSIWDNNAYNGGGQVYTSTGGGCGQIVGDDTVVGLGLAAARAAGRGPAALQAQEDFDASAIMHELGHNFGLNHGGAADEPHNCKVPYLSVMNYLYGNGLTTNGVKTLIDFYPPLTDASANDPVISPQAPRVSLPGLNEATLDETTALSTNSGWDQRWIWFWDGMRQFQSALIFNTLIQWDGDPTDADASTRVNIDLSPMNQIPDCQQAQNVLIRQLDPYNDWLNIALRRKPANNGGGGQAPLPNEPSVEAITLLQRLKTEADLAVTVTGPTEVQLGSNVDLVVTVTNNGRNPATANRTVTLPAGVSHLSNNGGCTLNAGKLGCPDVRLMPGQTAAVQVTVSIGANTTGQTRFVIADVTNASGSDPVAGNDRAQLALMIPPRVTAPPTVNTDRCTAPNLGTPTAVSELGDQVTFSKNAPAVFPLGATTVTWTGTDSRGVKGTANQLVTTFLGDDSTCCPAGTRIIVGTSSSQTLVGTISNECILGLGGNDTIQGGGGYDFIAGGSGNDNITGGSSRDYIWGGAGTDVIDAVAGDDFIDGGSESDNCSGGTGTNAIRACESASFCNASCCSSNSCSMPLPPPPLGCQPAFSKAQCTSYVAGTTVSRNGRNWECTNGNCANCATHTSCEPGNTGCPWGTVWTARATCP